MQEQDHASTPRLEGRERVAGAVDLAVGTNHSVVVLVALAAKSAVVTTLVAGTLIHRLVK